MSVCLRAAVFVLASSAVSQVSAAALQDNVGQAQIVPVVPEQAVQAGPLLEEPVSSQSLSFQAGADVQAPVPAKQVGVMPPVAQPQVGVMPPVNKPQVGVMPQVPVIDKVKSVDLDNVETRIEEAEAAVEAAVDAAVDSVDLEMVSEKYIAPTLMWIMQNINSINGSTIIDYIESLTGEGLLNSIETMDMPAFVQAIKDFGFVTFFQQLFGVDITPQLDALAQTTGAEFLQAFSDMTTQDIADWFERTGLAAAFKPFGINIVAVLSSFDQLSGADILDSIRTLSGKAFIEALESLTGEDLIKYINGSVNIALTQMRTQAAKALNLPEPEPFTSFDILQAMRAFQAFFEKLTGVVLPDMTEVLTSFDGAKLVADFRSLTTEDLLQSMGILLPVLFNQSLMGQASRPEGFEGVLNAVSDFVSNLNGDMLVQQLRNLDFTRTQEVMQAFANSPLVQKINNFDLQPYIAAFKQIDGSKLLEGIRQLTGEHINELLGGLSVLKYFQGLVGLDFAPLLQRIRDFNGAEALARISQVSPKDVKEGVQAVSSWANSLNKRNKMAVTPVAA